MNLRAIFPLICCMSVLCAKAQQSNLSVQTIATNIFNTGATPISYESSNGLTYFIDKGNLGTGIGNAVPGKAVWSDGTSAGTHSIDLPIIQAHLGMIDSVYFGLNAQGEVFSFAPLQRVRTQAQQFLKVSELVSMSGSHYFLGVPAGDTLARLWRLSPQGSLTQLASVDSVNAMTYNSGPIFLKTNGQYLLSSVLGRVHRFDANASSGVLLWRSVANLSYGFFVESINSITYFCNWGMVYQTDGTPAGTTLLPSMPTLGYVNYNGGYSSSCISDLKVFNNHLYMILFESSVSQDSRYPITYYSQRHNLIVHNGSTITSPSFQLYSYTYSSQGYPRHQVGLQFKELTNGKVLITINVSSTNGNYKDLYSVNAPNLPPTRLLQYGYPGLNTYGAPHFVRSPNMFEYRGRMVFNAYDESFYSSNSMFIPIQGYFEIDTASRRVLPIDMTQEPRILSLGHGNLFGIHRRDLQVLTDCPFVGRRPVVTNAVIDTISGQLRIRWQGPSDGSVRRYVLSLVNGPENVASPLVHYGSTFDTISGIAGQSNFEHRSPLPNLIGIYHLALRVESVNGVCGDTALYLGRFNYCNSQRPQVELRVRRVNALRRANITVSISPFISNRYTLSLIKNGINNAGYLNGDGSGNFSWTDTSASTADVYTVSITSSDLCLGSWLSGVTQLDTISCAGNRPVVVELRVRRINDLRRAYITVSVSPFPPNTYTLNLIKNGINNAGQLNGDGSGNFSWTDLSASSNDVYSVSITSNDLCLGSWVSGTTQMDTFSCPGFRPNVTVNDLLYSISPDGCPQMTLDYTISSAYALPAILRLGTNQLTTFNIGVGNTNHRQIYPVSNNGVQYIELDVTPSASECPAVSWRYPRPINTDSLFFRIDSVKVEPLSVRNQVSINWWTSRRGLPTQVFDVFKNGALFASNLTYPAQDSFFSIIDTFAQEGNLMYQVRSTNFGSCNVSAERYFNLQCDPTNPTNIIDLTAQETSPREWLITWKVIGRTRETRTSATVRQDTSLATTHTLRPEQVITYMPETETYQAVFNCPDRYTHTVMVFASNTFSTCADDQESVVCDCNSLVQRTTAFAVPNPSVGTLQIYYPFGTSIANLQLFNSLGNLVQDFGGRVHGDLLDLSSVPSGMYFLRVNYSSGGEMLSIQKL